MKLLNTSSEEQIKIRLAQRLWRLVRKKIKVIIMMSRMGGQRVHDMVMRKQIYKEGCKHSNQDEEIDISRKKVSKLIEENMDV